MKSIGRKIIIYNKSISVFEPYSGNKNLLNHFLEYNGLDILDVSQFRIRKNYFITPYLIYYPQNININYEIEELSHIY